MRLGGRNYRRCTWGMCTCPPLLMSEVTAASGKERSLTSDTFAETLGHFGLQINQSRPRIQSTYTDEHHLPRNRECMPLASMASLNLQKDNLQFHLVFRRSE